MSYMYGILQSECELQKELAVCKVSLWVLMYIFCIDPDVAVQGFIFVKFPCECLGRLV